MLKWLVRCFGPHDKMSPKTDKALNMRSTPRSLPTTDRVSAPVNKEYLSPIAGKSFGISARGSDSP